MKRLASEPGLSSPSFVARTKRTILSMMANVGMPLQFLESQSK